MSFAKYASFNLFGIIPWTQISKLEKKNYEKRIESPGRYILMAQLG